MPDQSELLVPLRSNGSALLTGKPIESVRRRLKLASLYFDHVYLEGGTYRLSAGPGGSSGFFEPPGDGETFRWQTPSRRGAEQRQPFTVAIGREDTPGVPARQMDTAIHSDASVSWTATLHPFADELPGGTDWISYTPTRDPDGEIGRLSDRWRWADERNAALQRAIPERFVRDAIIKHANRDLGFAVQYGLAVSVDPLHTQVIAQRFRDDNGWKLQGFAVPILFPAAGDFPGEAIADFRRDRHMARLRSILHEVEEEAASEAAEGDVEAAVQRACRRHIADAQGAVDSFGDVAHTLLQGFVIGGMTGFAIAGFTGPLGIVGGAAIGAAPGTIMKISDVIQRRRARGWVTLQQRIDGRFSELG
jgi:hypothetical protein